jgi:hypothetical protein
MHLRQWKRRQFITLLGGAAAACPLIARAQQPAKVPTIGVMGPTTASVAGQWTAALVQRLRELGWIEGRTLAIEYRWAQGQTERAAEIAAEFVHLKVDIIVTAGTSNVVAAKQVTSVIPIVSADLQMGHLCMAPTCLARRPDVVATDAASIDEEWCSEIPSKATLDEPPTHEHHRAGAAGFDRRRGANEFSAFDAILAGLDRPARLRAALLVTTAASKTPARPR